MNVLAIDTSTAHGSVALLVEGALVLDEQFTADRSHTSALYPILQHAKELAPHVDRIVVGLGPGSYAGVRVAIATAVGLGLAWDAELVGIPSVAALKTDESRYLAVGDARRETFYFTRVENGVCMDGPLLLSDAEVQARLDELPGWPVFAASMTPQVERAVVAVPSALLLARLAVTERGIVSRGELEPLYLREPHITKPKER